MARFKTKKILGMALVVLIGFYFYRSLSSNWTKVQEMQIDMGYEHVISVFFFFLAVIVSGLLWGKVFGRISERVVNSTESIRAHLAAWLLKYIPGQMGSLVYKIQWGSRYGASKKQSTLAFGYETLFLTLASTVIVIPVLLISFGDQFNLPLLELYFATLFILLATFNSYATRIFKVFFEKVANVKLQKKYILPLKELSIFTIWFTFPRLLNAIGFVILATTLYPVEVYMYVPLGATYIFAGIVGLYAFMVPSGLGVREAVIVAFGSVYFSVEEAIVLSLLARLYATIADGLVALLYLCLTKRIKKIASSELIK